MSPAGPRRRLGELALAAASLLVVLGVLETAARLTEPERTEREIADYLWDWEEHWDGEFYTLVSRSVGWPPSEEFNADGVRDRTHTVEKPPRVARVVMLGDSVTLGAGVAPSDAYPQRLQARLDAAGERIEVFNVGLWGWSTRQQRIAWERIARRYAPDLVVLAVCLNDVAELQNNLTRPPAWLSALHERSALVRRVVDAQGREIGAVEELFEEPQPARVREAWSLFFDEVEALRGEVEASGAGFALMVFPFRFQVLPDAPPPRAQEAILGFCAERGLRCADLLPLLAPLGGEAFVDYDHLSPVGTAAVAEHLDGGGWLPRPPSHPETLAGAGVDAGDVARLLATLEDHDAALRESALWALARHAASAAELPRAARERLGSDPDPGVRAMAARAIAAHGNPGAPTEEALYQALADSSEVARHASALALHALGPVSEDAPRLAAALASDDTYVQGFAAWSLGELGASAGEDAVPGLLAALRDQPLGRGVSAAALARLGDAAETAVPELIAALSSEQPRHRWNAALALGRLGDRGRPAAPALTAALEDPDERVRAHAATALGRLGMPDSVAPLTRALEDPDSQVRAMAARSLGWLAPASASARDALARARESDPHRKVRRHAERALREIGDGG